MIHSCCRHIRLDPLLVRRRELRKEPGHIACILPREVREEGHHPRARRVLEILVLLAALLHQHLHHPLGHLAEVRVHQRRLRLVRRKDARAYRLVLRLVALQRKRSFTDNSYGKRKGAADESRGRETTVHSLSTYHADLQWEVVDDEREDVTDRDRARHALQHARKRPDRIVAHLRGQRVTSTWAASHVHVSSESRPLHCEVRTYTDSA